MRYLRQSTAVEVKIGPFLDSTDGVTAETGLTISQADVRLAKNGGAWAQKNDANAAAHEENGWYEVALNTTDTNTLGVLMLAVAEAGALPVWHEFMVVPQQIWDSWFGSDLQQIDVAQFGNANGTFAAGRPEVNTTHWNGTAVTTPPAVNATQISGDATAADNLEAALDGTGGVTLSVTLGSNAIPAAAIAADAITAAKIANGAIDAATFAAGALDAVWSTAARTLTAGTNIVLAKGTGITGFNDLDAAGVRAAVGLAAANLDTQLGAISAKTANLPSDPADASDIAAAFSALNAAVATRAAPGDAMALTAGAVDAVWDEAVDGAITGRQSMRILNATQAGKVSGAGTTTVTIRDPADTTDRVVATVDADGNRSAVTLSL